MMLVVLAIVLEGVALFYQYVLGTGPCVVCIHIRLWVAAMLVVGLIGLTVSESKAFQVPLWLLMMAPIAGFAERSWHTLSVEKGWTFSTCGFDVGLPEWLPLDRWLPWVFEPTGSCGLTPEIFAGYTMAEVLIVVAGFSVLFSLVGLVRTILRPPAMYLH